MAEPRTTTACLEPSAHTATLWDGAEVFYRAWLPTAGTDKALLLFHRGHEHSGRLVELVEDLALSDIAVFAWDARGHGWSPGERGYAGSFADLVRDIESFVRHIEERHGIGREDMAVLGHSVGAVSVAAWVHDYAPPLRAMVLATPAFRIKLYLPFAVPALRLKQKLLGRGFVQSYVKARVLTHDAREAEAYRRDPLIFRQIADHILVDLFDAARRIVDDAAAIAVPTLVLAAGSDWVVRVSAQKRFFAGLSSAVKRFELLPGFYHAIFHERERHVPIGTVREFLREMFDRPPAPLSRLHADRKGYTKAEADRLTHPSANPTWPLQRLALGTVGRLSRGVALGWRTGFDSGQTLDYVYANRAQGTTPLGHFIDRRYLDSVGWRGIRQRKVILERLLRSTILGVHAEGRPVIVLDIAAGVGRYVLETVRALPQIPIAARLRDYQPRNLEAGSKLAKELGVAGATFEPGDAFDRGALAAVRPRPTIGIVSGLYELFADNERVLASLRGLADALEPGGFLIYTNQPWHPQLEFIARVLTNREGRPWVMRRRTQGEIDELVRAAGFAKFDMEIDDYGIFTVSLARREAAT